MAQEGVVNIKNKEGAAFCIPQALVMSGFKWLGEDSTDVLGNCTSDTQIAFDSSTLIVGFNIKFDMHWARRIGVDVNKVTIWDCQLAEFMLDYQQNRYPSMNSACEKYGMETKLDKVKDDYWNMGIDTDKVPHVVLREYLYGDLDRTEEIFKQQLKQFKGIEL